MPALSHKPAPIAALAALAVLAASLGGCAAALAGDEGENLAREPDASELAAREANARKASARETGGRQCFRAEQVNGFRTLDDEDGRRSDERVLIDVRASDTFELTFLHSCPEIRWARSVGFSQTGVGRVCDGLDVDLIVPDPTMGSYRCRVKSVRKLAPGEDGARAGAKD